MGFSKNLSRAEVTELFQDFLIFSTQELQFEEFVASRGLSMKQLGMKPLIEEEDTEIEGLTDNE